MTSNRWVKTISGFSSKQTTTIGRNRRSTMIVWHRALNACRRKERTKWPSNHYSTFSLRDQCSTKSGREIDMNSLELLLSFSVVDCLHRVDGTSHRSTGILLAILSWWRCTLCTMVNRQTSNLFPFIQSFHFYCTFPIYLSSICFFYHSNSFSLLSRWTNFQNYIFLIQSINCVKR